MQENQIITECREALKKTGLSGDQTEQFITTASGILQDCSRIFGEDNDFSYRIRKYFGCVELVLRITGDKIDLFASGEASSERRLKKTINNFVFDRETSVYAYYSFGTNVIIIRSAKKPESNNVLKQPMVIASILGLIGGIACQHLPADVSGFLLDSCVSPLMSLLLNMLTGIVGPIVFLSLVVSVSSLNSINELTEKGTFVIRRFVLCICFIMFVSTAVALCFFRVLGKGGGSFSPDAIIKLLFGIIPTSLFTPFIDNNIPQIMVLGLVAGAALLLLGDSAGAVRDTLSVLNDWVSQIMTIVLKLMPLIPFLSFFKMAANGEYDVVIKGWKYIAASYVCVIVCISIKFLKTSVRCGVKASVIWSKIKPLVTAVFLMGTATASLKMEYDTSRDKLGIDPSFSDFWIPLSYGMLLPSTTIAFALSTFFIAEATGTAVTLSFLVIFFIITLQLSLASPGLTPGITLIAESLGMDTDYVGLFSAFRVFTKNATAAFSVAYKMLEQTEAAYLTGNIDEEVLSSIDV